MSLFIIFIILFLFFFFTFWCGFRHCFNEKEEKIEKQRGGSNDISEILKLESQRSNVWPIKTLVLIISKLGRRFEVFFFFVFNKVNVKQT